MAGTLGTGAALQPNWHPALPNPGRKVHNEIKAMSDSHLRSAFHPNGSKQARNVFIAGLSVCQRETEAERVRERGSLMVSAGSNFVIGMLLSFN